MIIDVTQDLFTLSGGVVNNVVPGPLDASGVAITPAQIAANTTAIQWALTNLLGHEIYFPRLLPVGSSGHRYEYLVDTPLVANSIIYLKGDFGMRIGPYMFATDTPLIVLGNGYYENIEFFGNLGAARQVGVLNNNSLVSDRLSASANVHTHFKKCVFRDFSHHAIDNNYNKMTLDDCIITGNGASSIDGTGLGISSFLGILGHSTTCDLTIRGGLYRDCAWGAVYYAGTAHISGAKFMNNHRQYAVTGGGHIAANANSVSCTVHDNDFWNDVGLVTGASGCEVEALATWNVTCNRFYNMPGVAAIAMQGNNQHRIRDNRGSGNTAGVFQIHSGTPVWQQSGNYFV